MSLVTNNVCRPPGESSGGPARCGPEPFDRREIDVVECALAIQEEDDVARSCQICGKAPVHGHQISHAHNVSSRLWYPNVQRLKVIVGKTRRRMRVCTRCLRSGKVVKAAHRSARTTA